jgi:hypothetical protein
MFLHRASCIKMASGKGKLFGAISFGASGRDAGMNERDELPSAIRAEGDTLYGLRPAADDAVKLLPAKARCAPAALPVLRGGAQNLMIPKAELAPLPETGWRLC